MKNIILALRSLTKRGQHNLLKVVSLGIGLAVGLVLIAKVCFEQSYDNFYPDSESASFRRISRRLRVPLSFPMVLSPWPTHRLSSRQRFTLPTVVSSMSFHGLW